ncbi:hypothetical protein D3C73_1342780 [compost metagenome]
MHDNAFIFSCQVDAFADLLGRNKPVRIDTDYFPDDFGDLFERFVRVLFIQAAITGHYIVIIDIVKLDIGFKPDIAFPEIHLITFPLIRCSTSSDTIVQQIDI